MPPPRLTGFLFILLLGAGFVFFYGQSNVKLSATEGPDTTADFESSAIHHELDGDEPVEGQFVRRIVAVGDIHSDFGNALEVLKMAGVVDERGNWSGKVDILVQTGDIIDRGTDTIKLFLWMETLRSQAHAFGGEVVSHLGNHEWMNLLSDWRYVYENEIKTFGSVAARQRMLQTGRIGRAWAANYSVTSRVPLHPSLGATNMDYDPGSPISSTPLSHAALSFVHGGLAPDYEHLTPYPSRINNVGKRLLRKLQERKMPSPHPPAPYVGLPHDATNEERSLYGTNGPLWYRGWAEKSEPAVCASIDGVLQKTGVRRLIMGHTPNFHKIVSRCKGKVIIIDTGISHAYGGALSALSIKYTLTPHREDSRKYTERELVVAVYKNRQEVVAVDQRVITGLF